MNAWVNECAYAPSTVGKKYQQEQEYCGFFTCSPQSANHVEEKRL